MADTAIAYRGQHKANTATGVLVFAPDPVSEALVEIRRLLDDRRLNWAIWPRGRP